jgi:hypothetical protein
MKRVTCLALLAWALLPLGARADRIPITNKLGSISISAPGIVSFGSQLIGFNGIVAPRGHSLGSVSFTTGACLTNCTLDFSHSSTFSDVGSTFVVKGVGNSGVPRGVIFSGTFVGPVHWALISKNGANLVFQLRGVLKGQLYDGRVINFVTNQTIVTTVGQLAKDIGHISGGRTRIPVPEPGTFGLFGTGLVGIAGVVWHRIAARTKSH